MLAPVFIAFALACSSPDGETAREYAAALEPLLEKNAAVAEQIGLAAAAVYNGTADGAAVVEKWDAEILPRAQELRDEAAGLDAPGAWKAEHQALVDIWGARADAYRDLGDAVSKGDAELWGSARKRADEAKVLEEKWFIAANARLDDYGLSVPQFPNRPATKRQQTP